MLLQISAIGRGLDVVCRPWDNLYAEVGEPECRRIRGFLQELRVSPALRQSHISRSLF